MTTLEMQELLIEYSICTVDELSLVCALKGTNEETLKDILYVRTGYRSFDQFLD